MPSYKSVIRPNLIQQIRSTRKVSGLTHTFYRYPARFSPEFVRAITLEFTHPGDIILDPFMGGGTALVESSALGRQAIGFDISSLATFITKVKTTPLTKKNIQEITNWVDSLEPKLNLRNSTLHPKDWMDKGYLRHLNSSKTWRIRKLITLAIDAATELPTIKLENFARCGILAAAQWALDNKVNIPSADIFRERLYKIFDEMILGIESYTNNVRESFIKQGITKPIFPRCFTLRAQDIAPKYEGLHLGPPRLIITSPPYPGAHILYHRWQVHGRRETSAPFWIVGSQDGNGSAFYTFGDRNTHRGGSYFNELKASFNSIKQLVDRETLIVQLIGFRELETDLQNYLCAMADVGFRECMISEFSHNFDGRVWRNVPNRRWYALKNGTEKEVVLFHRIAD